MPGFGDILGNDAVKQHFRTAIETHRISHAYILSGEAGMGRKSLANAFAMTLLCEKGRTQPCMECHACRQMLSGNHPDVIYVSHEKPGSIGVEDVRRQINDTVSIRPYSSFFKVYIVDEAEKMTVQAQNALLKTIEEPPSYVVILLLSANSEAFLPTIRSRCVELKLKPLPDTVVRDYLTGAMKIPDAEARLYAAFARGNLGKAIRLADSGEFRSLYGQVPDLLRHIGDADISDLLARIRGWKEGHLDMEECIDFMQLWFRDALMLKVTRDADLLVFRDEYTALEELGRRTGYDGFERIFQAIGKAKLRLEANVNTELAMELLLLAIKENGS